ncbi:MAG: L-threonylcarbamoyladenylate synthase [Lachnospiraceae bacterium]|jgi:L-threonylcarbamoyladenylate synthase
MKTIILTESSCNIKKAASILKKGGTVAFSTDTVYGLGAVYDNQTAIRRIFEVKGRDEGKPLSILISDMEQVGLLTGHVPEEARSLMEAFWPGALTVILEKSDLVPDIVTAGKNTVGLRMPASRSARELIRRTGKPLAAPSANLSGKRSPVSAEEVSADLLGSIDMIIDSGESGTGVPSTVIEVRDGAVKVFREGTITEDMIRKQLGIENKIKGIIS